MSSCFGLRVKLDQSLFSVAVSFFRPPLELIFNVIYKTIQIDVHNLLFCFVSVKTKHPSQGLLELCCTNTRRYMISAPIWDNESLAHLLASNANHLYPFTKPSGKCRKNQARNKYKNLGPNREKSELPECENKRFSKWKVTPSCFVHLHFTSTVSLSHGAQDRHGRNLYLPSECHSQGSAGERTNSQQRTASP